MVKKPGVPHTKTKTPAANYWAAALFLFHENN